MQSLFIPVTNFLIYVIGFLTIFGLIEYFFII